MIETSDLSKALSVLVDLYYELQEFNDSSTQKRAIQIHSLCVAILALNQPPLNPYELAFNQIN